MADLSIRSEIRQGGIVAKLLDNESIAVCSTYIPAQIKTWIQDNRPALWQRIQGIYLESSVTQCPKDAGRNHFTLRW